MVSLLERTVHMMESRHSSGAHSAHIAALHKLVRVHATQGFALAQVSQLARLVRFCARALAEGHEAYADALLHVCALCALPFHRSSVHEDRMLAHEVGALLDAVAELLPLRETEVAIAVRAPGRASAPNAQRRARRDVRLPRPAITAHALAHLRARPRAPVPASAPAARRRRRCCMRSRWAACRRAGRCHPSRPSRRTARPPRAPRCACPSARA